MQASICAIEYYLPTKVLSTQALAEQFPQWSVQKIDNKTGIRERHIAAPDECSSDLAVCAAQRLFASGTCDPAEIDYLLLCTQSPDYFLPTTACLVQQRLDIPTTAGALDINLGCSGFVYGLGLAHGLIVSGQARCVLLITAETYSKFVHPEDKSARTIFGDAAAATLVRASADTDSPLIGPFVYGTDGSGAENLIVPTGAMRCGRSEQSARVVQDECGNKRTGDHLYMAGTEIVKFTLTAVPKCVHALLAKAAVEFSDIDLFVFHQANRYMLDLLRNKLKIPADKFVIAMDHCGNTVSSTIPIALKQAEMDGRLKAGTVAMLVGFGVGYSWGASLVRWTGTPAHVTPT